MRAVRVQKGPLIPVKMISANIDVLIVCNLVITFNAFRGKFLIVSNALPIALYVGAINVHERAGEIIKVTSINIRRVILDCRVNPIEFPIGALLSGR